MSDDDLRLPEVMSFALAAEALEISVRTLERARDRGELTASQLAERGCWVVRREHLLAWIDARRVEPRPIEAVTGPTRGAAMAAVGVRRRGGRPGPLTITEEMGRVA